MNDILQGLSQAARLVVTLDADLVEITLLSLQVSLTATLVASAIGLPLGAWLAVSRFPMRRGVVSLHQSRARHPVPPRSAHSR